ncbi:MAG: ABC transporter ATP-binding protein [Phycisphaeraceae bacterium]
MSIQIDNAVFRYPGERFELAVDALSIDADAPTAIIGPSGSGKTTLLRLIAGVIRPQRGAVRVLGEAVSAMSDAQARAFRIRHIGLVFQAYELVDYLDARDNILLPFRVSHALKLNPAARRRAEELAEATGITRLLGSRPAQLSQGERQRVAICRALVTRPRLVLADEPTGSLDPDNQRRIVELLRTASAQAGAGLVMVTHDHGLLNHFARVIDLPDIKSNPGDRA